MVTLLFEAKEKFVDKLLNDAIYCVPRNQRRYVWNSLNWSDLYDDVEIVVREQAENGGNPSHFIGSIVLKDEGREEGLQKYTIIDGQQRIISLTIFLAAIMFWFKKRNMTADFNGSLKYLIAKDIKANDREIVNSEYHLTLSQIINKLKGMSEEEISSYSINSFMTICTVSASKDKSIINAFKFFADKLQNLSDERIIAIRDAIIRIGYVNIISGSEEDSYTIFEILNARGLDLEDHELLKNYIMRYLQPVARRDDAKRIWEEIESNLGDTIKDFLRHYAIHKFNYEGGRQNTESVYKLIQRTTNKTGVDKLLDNIKKKSDYYRAFIDLSWCIESENKLFSFFKSKRVIIFRPILLTMKHQFELEKLTEEQYIEFLKFLYEFYICYKIIGQENSNLLSNSVYKYAYELENNFSIDRLNTFYSIMRSKLPTLESFKNSFRTIGYSHHWDFYKDQKSKERCQLVLELIEKYVSRREVNVDVNIEHILPDSDGVVNSQIGNLFYLEDNLNRRCKDKPLKEKYEIYSQSSLMCPRGFVERYRGKDFDPAKRTDFLAQLIYNNILNITQ